MANKIKKTEKQWQDCLTEEEYKILREKGTEAPFTGKYYKNKQDGTYLCAACGQEVFSSKTKYDSHTGWPSFYQPVSKDTVEEAKASSLGMNFAEVKCSRCGWPLRSRV